MSLTPEQVALLLPLLKAQQAGSSSNQTPPPSPEDTGNSKFTILEIFFFKKEGYTAAQNGKCGFAK